MVSSFSWSGDLTLPWFRNLSERDLCLLLLLLLREEDEEHVLTTREQTANVVVPILHTTIAMHDNDGVNLAKYI